MTQCGTVFPLSSAASEGKLRGAYAALHRGYTKPSDYAAERVKTVPLARALSFRWSERGGMYELLEAATASTTGARPNIFVTDRTRCGIDFSVFYYSEE